MVDLLVGQVMLMEALMKLQRCITIRVPLSQADGFLLTGTYNWNSGYNDTIAVKFHDVVFDAEL